ncbi:oxidoreductase [Capillimicrobium parvum]|uniref:N-methylproline demethylase n=1 Tax=Capillimicrobium parvum TaxID=2884022 RepID=A0A9E6XU38_9ACTN|nr:FAD-dependent oxidoreductase [Capillimicrobium parvum]UGS33817.1 putative N-methylproline demethylase [Capillimicrobium parvum]
MTHTLDALFEPLELGPLTLRNRVMAGPATLLYARDNVLSDRHIAYYRERAAGGAAVLVSEEHAAHPSALGAFRHACTAWEPRAVGPMRNLAAAVHEHGASQLIQLYAPGIADTSTLRLDDWEPLWGPSPLVTPDRGEHVVGMGQAEIDGMVEGFATSAANVAEAGLDGVELHGAHGWLIGQFLSPLFNHRTDAYGGGTEARCRLVLEIAQAVRERAPGLAVGVQLSVDEHVGAAGITPEETGAQIAVLAASGLFDYVSLSTGSQFSRHRTIPPMGTPDAVLAEHGRRAREIVAGRTAIALLGRIRHVATAARLLRDGHADIVGMTRAHLAEPAIAAKARAGHPERITPCVGENECLSRAFAGLEVACVMNPVTGREGDWAVPAPPSPRPRRLTVVGAGPAGLRAAAVAAERGHDVMLLERDDRPGGHLALLAQLPGRGDWQEGVDFLAAAAGRARVRIRLGTAATVDEIQDTGPDAVLLATGADWERTGRDPGRPGAPPIPGADAAHVLDVEDAARRVLAGGPAALGRHIVIVDDAGEVLPIALAELLGQGGARVEIVTRQAQAGARLHATLQAPEVLQRLAALDVHLRPGHVVERIAGDRLELIEGWSGRPAAIEGVDTVVLALRRAPRDDLAVPLREAGIEVHVIGDARAPRRAAEAIYDGERIGREL